MDENDLPYVLTFHARKRLLQRDISLEWVARVLMNPQWLEPDTKDPTLAHALSRIPEMGDRVLRVVYNWTTEPIRIITFHPDRRERNRP